MCAYFNNFLLFFKRKISYGHFCIFFLFIKKEIEILFYDYYPAEQY